MDQDKKYESDDEIPFGMYTVEPDPEAAPLNTEIISLSSVRQTPAILVFKSSNEYNPTRDALMLRAQLGTMLHSDTWNALVKDLILNTATGQQIMSGMYETLKKMDTNMLVPPVKKKRPYVRKKVASKETE